MCPFEVVIENTSATEFKGTVEFDNSITGDGAIFGATAITPPPPAPWTCPKNGQGFKCTADLTIPAKSKAPPVALTMDLGPGIGAVKEAKNCATLKDAPTPSCATISLTAQPDPNVTTPLTLAKNPVASQCSDGGGGCEFMVSITNPGPGEFNGPIEFTDVPTMGDGKQFLNLTVAGPPQPIVPEGAVASMSCVRAGEGFTCSTGVNNAKLPANKTILFPFNFKPGAISGATSIKNCATLKGSADKQCANIPLINGPLLRPHKISASTTCVPSCVFVFQLSNVGNNDATGPFFIDDKVTNDNGAMTIEVIDGDFLCFKTNPPGLRCVSIKQGNECSQAGRAIVREGYREWRHACAAVQRLPYRRRALQQGSC